MSDEASETEVKRGAFQKEKGEVILREHEYDGIQEFDQKLPNWWLFTFYFAIAWFLIYWVIYYHTDAYRTDSEKIVSNMSALHAHNEANLADELGAIYDDHPAHYCAKVAAGEAIYTTHCVACHAADLTSTLAVGDQKIPLPGLSLVDGEWKYGSQPLDLFKLINDGTPADSAGHNGAKMQAWGQMLKPEEIFEVTAFIISKNPDEFGL